MRKKRRLLFVSLGTVFCVGTALWIMATSLQPDGFSTLLDLRANHTCEVRWLDGAGQATKPFHPPREGRWWIDDNTLFVDASLHPKRRESRNAWRFSVQKEVLVVQAQTLDAITLRRIAGPPP